MLVLASSSPRRSELLSQAGFTFSVRPSSVPEVRRPSEDPVAYALRLAREKADSVFSSFYASPGGLPDQDLLVLGADTIVIAPDGSVFGKPADHQDASRMLHLLAGSTHQVVTSVCLCTQARTETASELTYVTMHSLSPQEIGDYVTTGEPFGKAGAYAIQGHAARWIPRIHGCYFNVVGLPLALVTSMLQSVGCTR